MEKMTRVGKSVTLKTTSGLVTPCTETAVSEWLRMVGCVKTSHTQASAAKP